MVEHHDRDSGRGGPSDLAAADSVYAIPAGELFSINMEGREGEKAGIFPGDVAILRRQDSANVGDITCVHFLDPAVGVPWLALFYYQPDGDRVRLVSPDPAQRVVVLPADQVSILGVLVGIEGTVPIAAGSELLCSGHRRFLRPDRCHICKMLAGDRKPWNVRLT